MHSISSELILTVLLSLLAARASGQNDGQYRPQSTTTRQPYNFSSLLSTTRRPVYNRYRGVTERGYVSSAGRYQSSNDGRYVPSDDGKYVHKDVPYQPGGGEYTGSAGGYSGGGQYTGNGGRYTGDVGGYNGDKDSFGRLGSTNSPTTFVTPSRTTVSILPYTYKTTTFAPRPTVKGTGTGEGGGGWKVIRWDKEQPKDGYRYLYETENGILGEENGRVENIDKEDAGIKATGFYEYTGDDGNLYRVEYSADENGFNPKGDHIWPIPDSVKRTLEWLRAHGELDR